MDRRKMIRDCIAKLGLSPRLRGTRYLEDAAYAWRPGALMKEIYPAIARKHGVSWQCVERNIRTALELAWKGERGNTSMIVEVFGLWALHERPKVGEAIAQIGWWTGGDLDENGVSY